MYLSTQRKRDILAVLKIFRANSLELSIFYTSFVPVIKTLSFMEMQISTIEKAFLGLPQVAEALATKEIKKLTSEFVNAQKSKFTKSLKLAKLVSDGYKWFKSAEGKEVLATEGIEWTAEEFFAKAYGFKKSYGYRLVKVGGLEEEKVEAYIAECERLEAEGEPQSRDLKDLLKYAKTGTIGGGDGESDGDGETETKQSGVWITIAVKGQNGESGYSIRVNADGTLKGDGAKLPELVAILTGLVGVDGRDAVIFDDAEEEEDEF